VKGGGGVVKAIVDKLRDAEKEAEKLVKDAEAKAAKDTVRYEREREKRLKNVHAEIESMRQRALVEAELLAEHEETEILAGAQREMNTVRAHADKKKEEAISLIIRKILEQ
jgi:V/A-type H+/Na+-transporting ATPase subunit G/H